MKSTRGNVGSLKTALSGLCVLMLVQVCAAPALASSMDQAGGMHNTHRTIATMQAFKAAYKPVLDQECVNAAVDADKCCECQYFLALAWFAEQQLIDATLVFNRDPTNKTARAMNESMDNALRAVELIMSSIENGM